MSSKNNGNNGNNGNGNGNGNNPANKTWEDEWRHGGTTDKVAGQTGAAKDESFTVNNADSIILDVLANDPGSAHLWSIDRTPWPALITCTYRARSTTWSCRAAPD